MTNNNPYAKAFSIKDISQLDSSQVDEMSYVDTNFLLDLNNTHSNFHQECSNFIKFIEKHGKFIVYSNFVEQEMLKKLRVEYAKNKYSTKKISDIDSLSDTEKRDIAQTALTDFQNFMGSLNHVSYNLGPGTQRSYEHSKVISSKSGIQFEDSLHISTALENGINSFVTNDSGFLDFDNGKNNINIYGSSNTIHNMASRTSNKTPLGFEINPSKPNT